MPFTNGSNGITNLTPSSTTAITARCFSPIRVTGAADAPLGLRRRNPISPTRSRRCAWRRPASSRILPERRLVRRELRRPHQGEGTLPEQPVATGNVSHQVVPEQYRTGIVDSGFFGSPHGIIGYDALPCIGWLLGAHQRDRRSERQLLRSRQQCRADLGSEREVDDGLREVRHRHGTRQPAVARQYRCASGDGGPDSELHLANGQDPDGHLYRPGYHGRPRETSTPIYCPA